MNGKNKKTSSGLKTGSTAEEASGSGTSVVFVRFSYSSIPTAVILRGSRSINLELFAILVYVVRDRHFPNLQHLVRQMRWNKCIGHIPFCGVSVGCLVSPVMRSTAARIGSTGPPLSRGTFKHLISGDIGEIISWSKYHANRRSRSKVIGLGVFESFGLSCFVCAKENLVSLECDTLECDTLAFDTLECDTLEHF
jgi:hypothetical protein